MNCYIWKDVPSHIGAYSVNEVGDVRSVNRGNLIMKVQLDRYGYLYVKLSNKGSSKKMKIHRLVAMTFIDNPLNLPCVNHIDGNKLNNSMSNLEWCTVAHNNLDKINRLYLRECNGECMTLKEWAKRFGIARSTLVSRMRRGITLEMLSEINA